MSGKRQHFIPQFLQRGFSFDNGRKQQYTWQYRLDGKILPANIKNVGTEGFFYSLDTDHSIDDIITDAEDGFSDLVVALKNNNFEGLLPLDIARFISHLEVRTRHIRMSTQESFLFFMKSFEDIFLQKESIITYVMRVITSKPDKFEELIERQLESMDIPYLDKLKLKELMTENSSLWLPAVAEDITKIYKPLLVDLVREKLPRVIKEGHLKALGKSIYPELKVDDYAQLSFNVVNMTHDLPLGDNIVLFEVEGERAFKPFNEKGDILKNIYLPISSRQLLCGSSKGCMPNLYNIDLHIAECSLEYFISPVKNERLLEMQKSINKNAYVISRDNIIKIFFELLDGDCDWL